MIIIAAFHEMDENHDGAVTQSEFIEVCTFFLYLSIIYFKLFIIYNLISPTLQACMAQKKFSTMLTLKIIDVFIAEDISSNHQQQQQQRAAEEHQI